MRMKKNKMMRLASWLLVLTLLTTCIISGTFAKYVTSDEADDTARVAKWGVTASISGSLFGAHYNEYKYSEENEEEAAESNKISASYEGSVDSDNGADPNQEDSGYLGDSKDIVAPGTKSDNMVIKVSGTPEVAGKVAVEVDTNEKNGNTYTKNYSDIWLESGQYAVMTDVTDTVVTKDDTNGLYIKEGNTYRLALDSDYPTDTTNTKLPNYYRLIDNVNMGNYGDTETQPRIKDGKYYPILWSFSYFKGEDPFSGEDVEAGLHNISEIKKSIEEEEEFNGKTFKSYEKLSDTIGGMTINWKWPINSGDAEDTDNAILDGCDTILGNLMAWSDGTEENVPASGYQVVQFRNNSWNAVTVQKPDENGVTYATITVVEQEVEQEVEVACLTVGFNVKVTVSQVD